MPCSLSVIIPARAGEPRLDALVAMLEGEPAVEEVLVRSDGSRARSLNVGAAQARGDLLWFLHADSRLAPDTVARLLAAAAQHPDALLFFDLAFLDDASPLVRLNQWGGNLRARLLHLPFGDQGLACRSEVFARIGPYREDVPYGEDHLLVWRAHRARVPVRPVGVPLATSARTYAAAGWLRLTLRYQALWLKQALPELWHLLRERLA